jgi:hypothetical protein
MINYLLDNPEIMTTIEYSLVGGAVALLTAVIYTIKKDI